MATNVSLPVDDEEIVYLEEDMLTSKKNKPKIGQSVKIIGNSDDQSEDSKSRREIITPWANLENGIIKTKQNVIQVT